MKIPPVISADTIAERLRQLASELETEYFGRFRVKEELRELAAALEVFGRQNELK